MNGKKLSVTALGLALCAALSIGLMSLAGCSSASARPVLKVGMECVYPPFNWTQDSDANGAVQIGSTSEYAGGYDVEMAKKVADSLGYDLEIVKTEWTGLIPALQSGKINAIIAGMSPTDERKEAIDFSDPYYRADIVVVTMSAGKYAGAKSLADLSGVTISSQLGTLWYDLLDQIPNANKLPALDTVSAMQVALTSGKIDAYVTDLPTALAVQYADPSVTTLQFEEGKGFQVSENQVDLSIGINKNDEDLRNKVNDALSKITQEERTALMDAAIKNQPLVQ